MPAFRYLAKASPRETVRGEMRAENSAALVARLTEQGLFPLEIEQVRDDGQKRFALQSLFARRRRRAESITFTQQLALMLFSGLTLHAALGLLQKQYKGRPMQQVIHDLVEKLRDGQRFSEACEAWPAYFSKFYVNMIRAGETGGMLELVLGHLAEYLEHENDVRRHIQVALAYPLFMLGMGLITVSVLLTFVVPNIVSMFEDIGQALPLPTRILVVLSDLASAYWPVALLLIASGALFWHFKGNDPALRKKLDEYKLRLPFFSGLIIQGEVAQFGRTLGALLAHAVPIHLAFEVVVASCKNRIIQSEFQAAATAIKRGGGIGASLSTARHLPAMLGDMIRVAEETNQLENALNKVAQASARDVEQRIALFTKLLEPAMIGLLGLMIGFIVFAIMMPIFQMDFVVQ